MNVSGTRPTATGHERHDADWRFLWYEHADGTTMAPWVTAVIGLLTLAILMLS